MVSRSLTILRANGCVNLTAHMSIGKKKHLTPNRYPLSQWYLHEYYIFWKFYKQSMVFNTPYIYTYTPKKKLY